MWNIAPRKLNGRTPETPPPPPPVSTQPAPRVAAAPILQPTNDYMDLKVSIHQELLGLMNLAALETMSREQIAAEVAELVNEQLHQKSHLLNALERRNLADEIVDELIGLGPLEPLLKDEAVADILVNGPYQVWVERRGKLELTRVKFRDEKHLQRIIGKIVSAIGRRVDEASPMVDARLPDGSRVNAIIPPLAIDGSLVSIRKFSKKPITFEEMICRGSVPRAVSEVLKEVVRCRRNIIVSGGTGSGKTTMLNALSTFIEPDERIVTIEDSAELQLQQVHVCRLETRPPNMEGRGEVTMRDLVKNSLRMRPDRIILGETRGGEAFDVLQSMNTGHDGSMTTIHANTPRDGLGRLEQMIGMSGLEISPRAARMQIASAVHVILQLERMSDGKRRMTSVSEITGMEGDVVTMQEIFRFRRTGRGADGAILGRFEATGVRPKFMDYITARGGKLSPELFNPDRDLGAEA
ncbi:MAG: CpaF family protein [Sphingomonadaceae bacterium]|nr:CpaF family protein [Sphingomonadaceae bacterium]